MTGVARPLWLSRPRVSFPAIREWLLAAFFIALAFSISASQILLALLFLLVLPWRSALRSAGGPRWIRDLAREIWVD
ncbi:MAG: hypothetical protein ACRELA_16420, partial [Candidatus Rokuibacteriota bacterium]